MYRPPVKTAEQLEMEKAIKASMRHEEEEFDAQLELALAMSLAPPEEAGMDLPESPRREPVYPLDPSAGGAYPCGRFTPVESQRGARLLDESLCGAKFTPSRDSPPPLVDSPRGADPAVAAYIDGLLAGLSPAEARARQAIQTSKDAMAFASVLDEAPVAEPDDDDDPEYQEALLRSIKDAQEQDLPPVPELSLEEQLEIDRLFLDQGEDMDCA